MNLKSGMIGLLALTAGISFAQPTYHLTDLGSLGAPSSFAYGVDSLGQVVGWADTAGGAQAAFLYTGGVMTDLGSLGGTTSEALAINEAGQIVGDSYLSATVYHAFLYSGGIMQDLGSFGGNSGAMGINAAGQVVGFAKTAADEQHGFLYSGGVLHDLGMFGGSWGAYAAAIDSSAQIACGTSFYGKINQYAYIYASGLLTGIGTLGGDTWAYGINDGGQVVGYSGTANDAAFHAFWYYSSGIHDLGTLGGTNSHAYGINNLAQVVGDAQTTGDAATHAFLYSGGTMYDLNNLLDSSGSGYTVFVARGIAQNGLIAATAQSPLSLNRAVLLTPNAGLAGTVTLQDYVGDKTKVPVTFELRFPGTPTAAQKLTVYLKSDGSYQCCTTLSGTYDVAVKASHWLRKKMASVTLTGTGFTAGMNFSLVNGDVNGDDNINLADATAISLAWRTRPGDAKWNPNADLNGDGTVNLADAVIVSKNWRKTGDP